MKVGELREILNKCELKDDDVILFNVSPETEDLRILCDQYEASLGFVTYDWWSIGGRDTKSYLSLILDLSIARKNND